MSQINYIIATYAGIYRTAKEFVLQEQLESIYKILTLKLSLKLPSCISQITIVCPPLKHPLYENYYKQEKWESIFINELPHVKLVFQDYIGENQDYCYDQWIQGCTKYPQYDYYILMKDDYYIYLEDLMFDQHLIDYYRKVAPDNIGYLASLSRHDMHHGYHAAISNGIVSNETIKRFDDMLGYYYHIRQANRYPQVTFSKIFLHLNIPILNMSEEYEAWFWNSYSQTLECLSSPSKKLMIPIQYKDKESSFYPIENTCIEHPILFLIGEYNDDVYERYKKQYTIYMCLFVEDSRVQTNYSILDEPFDYPSIKDEASTNIKIKMMFSHPYLSGYKKCLELYKIRRDYNPDNTIIVLPFNQTPKYDLTNLTQKGVYWPDFVAPEEPLTFETLINPMYSSSSEGSSIILSKNIALSPVDGEPVFLICSVVSPTMINRTVFTPKERCDHTIRQLKSIRQYYPKSYIVLLESSYISAAGYVSELAKYADKTVWFVDDEVALHHAHLNPNKNLTEVYMMSLALSDIIKYKTNTNICPSHIAKFGGRYWLDEPINLFSNDIVMNATYEDVYLTTIIYPVFYSIPHRYLEEFAALQHRMLLLMEKQFTDVERLLWSEFAINKNLQDLKTFRIKGYTARGYFTFI
jgi:hypothetical protein